MDITNNSGAPITITQFFSYWVDSPASQKIDELFLNGASIWNTSDPDSPTDFPSEGGGGFSGATIPDATTYTFDVIFSNNLQAPGSMYVIFNTSTPCQVTRSW